MKRRTDHYASYKDPAAKVFYYEDEQDHIFRELNTSYLQHYHHLRSSGLADELIKKKWLIDFKEITDADSDKIILKAIKIPFVSYPYEWTFNQWKDAALLTLKVQYQALRFGMILKDASPFNIVFDGAKPVFIDISSFEIFEVGKPWQAYKQFSESFYMPLLLVKYYGSVGNEIYLSNPNGIPLNKGLPLLPAKAHFNFNTLFYLTLPDKIRKRVNNVKKQQNSSKRFTQKSASQFAEQLYSNINHIKQAKKISKWNSYYEEGKIDAGYLKEKESILKEWLSKNYSQKTLIDFGCNTGKFSELLSPCLKTIFAFDEDINSVDELYTTCRVNKINNIFSFCASITQPTPAGGFNNLERQALTYRLKADVGMALALIHHLCISNNITFDMTADMFATACKELVIEFIPKEDEKILLLLSNRQDIFGWYSFENFLKAFEKKFALIKTYQFSNGRLLAHFIIK